MIRSAHTTPSTPTTPVPPPAPPSATAVPAAPAPNALPSPKDRRRLREAKALSQLQVASIVGVTRETVRSWEAGRTSPRGRKREMYARLLAGIEEELASRGEAVPVRTTHAEPAPAERTRMTETAGATGTAGTPGRTQTTGATAVPGAPEASGIPGASGTAGTAGTAGPSRDAGTAEAIAAAVAAGPADVFPEKAREASAESAVRAAGGESFVGDRATALGKGRAGEKPPRARSRTRGRLRARISTRMPSGPTPVAPDAGTPAPAETSAPQPVSVPHVPAPQAPALETAAPETEAQEVPSQAAAPPGTADPEAAPQEAATQAAASPQAAPQKAAAQTAASPQAATQEAATQAVTTSEAADLPTPSQAFDRLYAHIAPSLVRQAYLLTGRHRLSHESVERAFHLAWQRWPEVATDRDPAGWVRAAAHEYATSPWHRLRRGHAQIDPPPAGTNDASRTDAGTRAAPGHAGADASRTAQGPGAGPGEQALLDALLELPAPYRRTLVLYDGLGLDLPETAAETEATTPATAHRLEHARSVVARKLPELAEAPTPADQSALLQERLSALALTQPADGLPPGETVRTRSERKIRFWTRAAIAFTTLIVGATAFTLSTAPTRYEPPLPPGDPVGGVPARSGPQPLSAYDKELRAKLRSAPVNGPERLVPQFR